MKRSLPAMALLIAVLMAVTGCSGISVSTSSDTAAIAGKAAGAYVAAKYPDSVSTVTTYAKGLLSIASEGKITGDQVAAAVAALYALTGDDAEVRALIVAVTSAITVEIRTGTVNDQVVSALAGFVEGLSVAL